MKKWNQIIAVMVLSTAALAGSREDLINRMIQSQTAPVTNRISSLSASQIAQSTVASRNSYIVLPTGDIVQHRAPYQRSSDSEWEYAPKQGIYEDYSLVDIDAAVTQVVKDGQVLAEHNDIMIEAQGLSVVTGDRIKGVAQRIGSFKYVTVLGAPRTIARLRLLPQSGLTRATLLKYLDSNPSFTYLADVTMRCPHCNGTGKLRQNTGAVYTCFDCDGKTTLTLKKPVTITK